LVPFALQAAIFAGLQKLGFFLLGLLRRGGDEAEA